MILKIADFFRRMHREDKGFTLIELLVVIAIIGIIAAIAVPAIVDRTEDARESADESNVRMIKNALDLYYLDNNEYPPNLAALEDEYLDEVPKNPWEDSEDYDENYTQGADGESYTFSGFAEDE